MTKLKTEIAVRVTLPVAIALALMAVATLVVLGVSAASWKTTISSQSVPEETKSVTQRCDNGADLVKQYFEHIQADTDLIRGYVSDIVRSVENPQTSYANYYGVAAVDPAEPPPPYVTSATGEKQSTGYSVWFNKNDGIAANHPLLTMPGGHMDNIWRSLWRSSNKYQSLYVGFPDQTYRGFPWKRLESFPSFQSVCQTTGQTVVGYDPTCRGWYKLASDNRNSPVPLFTPPYQDASTGLTVITAAAAIQTASGAFSGVVAVDVTMSNIDRFMNKEKVLTSGFAYIFDDTKNLVSYPSLARNRVYSVVEIELGSPAIPSEQVALDAILNTIIATNTSSPPVLQFAYQKRGVDWILTARRAGATGMSVAYSVPRAEVVGAANAVSNTVDTAIIVGVILIVAVLCVMIGISICVNNRLSRAIGDPAKQLADVADAVAKNEPITTDFADEKFSTNEVKETSRNFVKLVHAVRFVKGFKDAKTDMHVALAQLQEVEEMLASSENVQGLGAVYNNIALTILEVEGEDPKRAVDYARKAVANAVGVRDSLGENDHEGRRELTGVVCSRKVTLGAALLAAHELEEAESELSKAIGIAEHRGDTMTAIRGKSALAEVLLKTNREDDAREILLGGVKASALLLAKSPDDPEKVRILQRYAEALSVLELRAHNPIGSIQWSQCVLASSANIDQDILRRSLLNLAKCYEISDPAAAAMWRDEYNKTARTAGFATAASMLRHIIFCVDVSGSMAGMPITLVKQAVTPNTTIVRPSVPLMNCFGKKDFH